MSLPAPPPARPGRPRGRAPLLVGAALVAATVAGLAHVRLRHPTNDNPLFWQDPANVGIVISSTGSADISDGSHETALRNAIGAWNDLTGTSVQLVEDASPVAQARTDWEQDDLHLIWFDENDSSSYFPGSSSTVAITPVWFFSNGRIADADVIYNGKDFQFTTSGEMGRFDVQDVGTHELGHLLGLDHSGWAGASMYPYVDSRIILHRSLSLDELRGMRDAYPSGSHARITGTVERASDSSVVAGAHVVAVDASGRTSAGALSETDGTFELDGLEAGTYQVYAAPLDEPVGAANLGAGYVVQTDFMATVHGNVAVTAGGATDLGNLTVDPGSSLNLGRSSDRFPLRCKAGQTTALVVRGTGLSAGSTLTASDPSLTVTPSAWFGSQVSFQVSVPAGAAPGHVDLTVVDSSSDRSVLTAGLEITPPDPTVTLVSPNQATHSGGTAVTVSGSNFGPGARVVLAGEIYEDGVSGGATVVDENTITLTTRASQAGTWDVVVIDATGVEGRLASGFQFVSLPVLTSVFPPAGDDAGGTEVTLKGSNFLAGMTVQIDGVTQPSVTVVDAATARFTTQVGLAGGPYTLTVSNPGGGLASSSFSYAAQPDPFVSTIAPATADVGGGEVITITGSSFPSDAAVVFGADPQTGQGGTAAASVVRVDASTLEVTTPAHGSGTTTVLVSSAGSGQADLLSSAFQFTGGGGGGGCYAVPVGGAPPGGRGLDLLALVALLAGWLAWRGRPRTRALPLGSRGGRP